MPADKRTILECVLRCGAVMIVTPRIDLGTAIEQKVRNLDGRSETQRPLTIPAFRVHDLRSGIDDRAQLVDPAKPRCSVRGECRAARDQVPRGRFIALVQHAA